MSIGTRISDMDAVAANTLPADASFPVVYPGRTGGSGENVRVEADDLLSPYPTSATLAASGGSALVGHIASGTGAVARTVQSKLRDVVSVADYGAVGDNSTDCYAAFVAAAASLDTSSGRGGTILVPKGTFVLSQSFVVPDRIMIVGQGPRTSIINAGFTSGSILTFDSVTNGGIIGCRLGFGAGTGVVGIDIKTTTSTARDLRFADLEIVGGTIGGQIGIRSIATSPHIVTELTFDDIAIKNMDRPVVEIDTEGNFWSEITVDQFAFSVARNAFDCQSLASMYRARVAGAPTAGSFAFSNSGARNIIDLVVDIGAASGALNLAANGYQIVRLVRPEGLTPLGTVGVHNRVEDADLGISSAIRPSSPVGTINTGVLYGGSGVPDNAGGANGDFYLRSDTPGSANQRLYVKTAGAWVGIL